jgi:hypothetical protein
MHLLGLHVYTKHHTWQTCTGNPKLLVPGPGSTTYVLHDFEQTLPLSEPQFPCLPQGQWVRENFPWLLHLAFLPVLC